MIAAHLGLDISRSENVAEIGALLVVIGLTMPSWGPCISKLVHRTRRLITYARLWPLWSCFYALDPSIAFDDRHADGTEASSSRLRSMLRTVRDPEYHIARRVVEIRDGILSLRPYQDPEVAQRARDYYVELGLLGDDLDAAVIAAQIRLARDANGSAPHREQPSSPVMGNVPADLDAELAWLLKVTRHVTAKPAVFSVHDTIDPTPAGGAP